MSADNKLSPADLHTASLQAAPGVFTVPSGQPGVVASGLPEYADVLVELDKLQNKKTNWLSAVVVLAVSVLLFAAAGAAWRSWELVGLLVPILMFHELGHFVAMRVFKYRNTRMFFIPFFGAAVTGQHYNVPGWKKAIVSLMGPVPGIALGIVLGGVGLAVGPPLLVKGAIFMLLLNAFNLVPVLPLDGGWVMHTILFCRHYLLDVAFRTLAVVGLVLIGWASGDWVLAFVAIPLAISLPLAYRTARIADKLRSAGWTPQSSDDHTIPPVAAQSIIGEVRASFPSGLTNKNAAQITLNIFESLNARPPGWLASAALLFVHFGSFCAAAVACLIFMLAQRPVPPDAPKNAAPRPQISYISESEAAP